jgi:peroxiredoxin
MPRALRSTLLGLGCLLAGAATFAPGLLRAAPPPPPVGQRVADFSANDDQGNAHSLSGYHGKTVVLVFWGSACPTSQAYAQRIQAVASAATGRGAVVLGVASNAGDDAATVGRAKGGQGLSIPILIDQGGAIAHACGAVVTPTACVIDGEGVMRYLGAIDDDPQGGRRNATQYLRDAVDAVLSGQAPAQATTRATGSRISP